jgi:molybdopterin molybdotransferase
LTVRRAGAQRPGDDSRRAGAQRPGVFDDGEVTTYGPPASHHLRWLASANCLLELAEDITELAAGSKVRVWDLS